MRYFNLIFTKHAIARIYERGLTKELARETFNHPDETKNAKKEGMEFLKYFNGFRTKLIAKQNEKNEWIVVSFWRDPPLPGTNDAKKSKRWKEYRNAGFWGKIWLQIKQQLGI